MMYDLYDVYKFSLGLLFIVHLCVLNFLVIMVALCNRADHYIFAL